MIDAVFLAIIYTPIALAFNLFVILTSPIWALIAAYFKLSTLPFPLWIVHTHDDDIYGSKTTDQPIPPTFFGRFKTAVWWLCRNPGYGFDAYVLGYDADSVVQIYRTTRSRFGGSTFAWAYYQIEITKGRTRFCYNADIPLFAGRYAKFAIGWNYHNQAGRHMFKFDFNPFKSVDDGRSPVQ